MYIACNGTMPGSSDSAVVITATDCLCPVCKMQTRVLKSRLRCANRYLAQLLRTTPMESLLNRHVDMTAEIKTLDSDMQVRHTSTQKLRRQNPVCRCFLPTHADNSSVLAPVFCRFEHRHAWPIHGRLPMTPIPAA